MAHFIFLIMAPLTRSLFKTVVRHTFEQLPDELLIEVLSNLGDRDLGAALCSGKRFSVLKEQIWRAVCAKRWPHWFAITKSTQVPWRRQAELFSLRERELLVQPNQQAIQKTQTVVTPNNRAVLAEWLAEVCLEAFEQPSGGLTVLPTVCIAEDRHPLKVLGAMYRCPGIGSWSPPLYSRPSLILTTTFHSTTWRSSHGKRLPLGPVVLPLLSVGGQTSTLLDEASALPAQFNSP